MKIEFTIPGPPRGKGRPRFARCGNCVRTYTPATTEEYEKLVRLSWRTQSGKKFDSGVPIHINLLFYMPIPQSLSEKKKKELDGTPHHKKSDIDNLAKAVLDGCNGYVYADDAQISSLSAKKQYSFEPRAEVMIENA